MAVVIFGFSTSTDVLQLGVSESFLVVFIH